MRNTTFAILLAATLAHPLAAQEPEGKADPAATAAAAATASDAVNPLSRTQAFNVHDYYVPSLTEAPDEISNTAWLRYAQSVGSWIVRASLPFSRVPAGDGTLKSGMGDFNVFGAYLFDTPSGTSFGVGPQLTAPTATADETGTGQWQAGLASIYFNGQSKVVQWGGLVTWQTDFAGDDDRPGTNVLAVQPFFFVQMGKGLYLRSTGIMAFNLENGSYNVPLGVGLGKVIPAGKTVFNVFVEPQFTVASHGAYQPDLQIFVGINAQFLK
jgi:hypothetical protein